MHCLGTLQALARDLLLIVKPYNKANWDKCLIAIQLATAFFFSLCTLVMQELSDSADPRSDNMENQPARLVESPAIGCWKPLHFLRLSLFAFIKLSRKLKEIIWASVEEKWTYYEWQGEKKTPRKPCQVRHLEKDFGNLTLLPVLLQNRSATSVGPTKVPFVRHTLLSTFLPCVISRPRHTQRTLCFRLFFY